MGPPFHVDLVVCLFHLIGHDRRNFPRRIKGKCFFGADRANQEIVEEVPLAVAR